MGRTDLSASDGWRVVRRRTDRAIWAVRRVEAIVSDGRAFRAEQVTDGSSPVRAASRERVSSRVAVGAVAVTTVSGRASVVPRRIGRANPKSGRSDGVTRLACRALGGSSCMTFERFNTSGTGSIPATDMVQGDGWLPRGCPVADTCPPSIATRCREGRDGWEVARGDVSAVGRREWRMGSLMAIRIAFQRAGLVCSSPQ